MKQTRKTNLLKKLDVVVMEKSNYNVFIYFQEFYILLYTHILDQDKNVPKCDQIRENKNAGDFISLFSLSLCLFITKSF